ncbi:MAG: hypothetical protein E7I22_01090 [Bifidobacterium longum]|nr:hypothetical protein [Bifidobacterium longum]
MSITFEDIKRNRKALLDKRDNRKFELQELGRKLFHEYIDSLALPAKTWTDANKIEREYVTHGEMNEKGLFEQKALAAFHLDKDHRLKFRISTVVDDSSFNGGSYYLIPIALWKENGRLHVDIGDGKQTLMVSNPDEACAFYQVCAAIKQQILSSLIDPRLD